MTHAWVYFWQLEGDHLVVTPTPSALGVAEVVLLLEELPEVGALPSPLEHVLFVQVLDLGPQMFPLLPRRVTGTNTRLTFENIFSLQLQSNSDKRNT